MSDFEYQRSWAATPMFFKAPHPPACGQEKLAADPYQHAAVEYAMSRNHVIYGDEPGLGKTIEGILTSNTIGAKRTLVVCPASLRWNWQKEIWRWSDIGDVKVSVSAKGKDGASTQHHYTVISYDLLRNKDIHAALMDARWDHLILDEAHMIKDPNGNARTKALVGYHDHGHVKGLIDVAGRVSLLSGTIMPNQPDECYNAIRLTDWSAIDHASLEDFRELYYGYGEGWITKRRYNEASGQIEFKREWSDSVRNMPQNLDDLNYRMRKHCMVRRLKVHVYDQLPTKRWQMFPMQYDADIKAALKHPGWREVERLFEADPESFAPWSPFDGEAISTARRLLGEAKAPQVARYIKDLLESGVQKVVVSAWHKNVLAYLREHLQGYGLLFMDSGTPGLKRQQAVDLFQTAPEHRIMLGQTMILGLGWTLTAAQDWVGAEMDWVPGVNDQMFDRINRRGQKGQYTLAHVPIIPGTIDEKLMGAAVNKSRNIHAALDRKLDLM